MNKAPATLGLYDKFNSNIGLDFVGISSLAPSLSHASSWIKVKGQTSNILGTSRFWTLLQWPLLEHVNQLLKLTNDNLDCSKCFSLFLS